MVSNADFAYRLEKLVKNSGFLIFRKWIYTPRSMTVTANIVILAASAVSGIVSARALGPTGRGQLTVLMLWSGLIQTVGCVGLQSSCTYYVARWPERKAGFTNWLARILVRQSIIMTAASWLMFASLAHRLGLSTVLIVEYSTWPGACTVGLYGAAIAQGSLDFARFNAIRLLSGALPVLLMMSIAYLARLTLAEAGAAYVIPVWVSAAVGGWWLWRVARHVKGGAMTTRQRRFVWSYGLRSMASMTSAAVNNSADEFTLGMLGRAHFLGLYSVAASAGALVPTIIVPFGLVGLPTVAALEGRAKVLASWQVLRRAVFATVALVPAIGSLLPWIVPRVYGTRYTQAVFPAEILLIGVSLAAITSVVHALLQAYGFPGFASITQGIGGLITVTGTVVAARHSLGAVAGVSTIGFFVSLGLALWKLKMATRQENRVGSAAAEVDVTPTVVQAPSGTLIAQPVDEQA